MNESEKEIIMENIKSIISKFEALKRKKPKSTEIDKFVAEQPPDVAEILRPLLHFDMFEAWLKITTQRRTFDWIRKEKRQKRGGASKIESIDDTNGDDNPFMNILSSSDNPAASLLAQEIIDAFDRLDEPQKQICSLYYVEGYNDREIGEMLGRKENTVTVYRRRGAKTLQEILRRMGY